MMMGNLCKEKSANVLQQKKFPVLATTRFNSANLLNFLPCMTVAKFSFRSCSIDRVDFFYGREVV